MEFPNYLWNASLARWNIGDKRWEGDLLATAAGGKTDTARRISAEVQFFTRRMLFGNWLVVLRSFRGIALLVFFTELPGYDPT